MHRILPLTLLLVAACSYRAKPAREAEGLDTGAAVQVMVHPKIDDDVYVSERTAERMDDGRMKVRVVFVSDKKRDLSIIAQASWLDENGNLVGTGNARTVVLPSTVPVLFEEASYTARANSCRIALRPSSTTRRS